MCGLSLSRHRRAGGDPREWRHVRRGVLATFGYDSLGRRTSLTRGNGAVTSYGYDAVSRLTSQGEDLSGTSHDQSSTFTFNPAGQIASVSRSNPGSSPGQADAYAFTGHANGSRTDIHNGLNQVTPAAAPASATTRAATPTGSARRSMPTSRSCPLKIAGTRTNARASRASGCATATAGLAESYFPERLKRR